MRHSTLVGGKVNFAHLVAGRGCGDDAEMDSRLDTGEENLVWTEPTESSSIFQKKVRVTAKDGDGIG